MRDITNRIEEGREIIRKHPRVDISLEELDQFYDMFLKEVDAHGNPPGDFMGIVGKAFYMGVATGYRLK